MSNCIYFIGEKRRRGAVKIGLTNNLPSRLIALQAGNSVDLLVIGTIAVRGRQACFEAESIVKNVFRSKVKRSEWFNLQITADDIKRLGEWLMLCEPRLFGTDL